MDNKETIKKLHERIVRLESFINLMKITNKDKTEAARIWRRITPDSEGFEEKFINKYSIKEYRKRGFSEEFEQFDFKTTVEIFGRLGDGYKKLRAWMDFQRKLIDTLGLWEYRESSYWAELVWFVRCAVEYYQDAIIERILKEGKHFEGSGNRPQWNPDKTVEWWDELYPSFSIKKTEVYNEIRKRHNPNDPNTIEGVPNTPSERTIRNQLQDAKRL